MMNANTIRTVWGFYKSQILRCLPASFGGSSLAGICNYLPIDDSISTSGQPTARQFELIRAAGFTTVINLAPHHAENALPDETGLLRSLGLRYVHIPVDFKNPTATDFDLFTQSMNMAVGEKIWVHCAANMRVSAFVYKYRRDIRGDNHQVARSDLQRIWEPYGIWKDFLA